MNTIPYENEFGLWVSLDRYKQSQHALWMARAERAKAKYEFYLYRNIYTSHAYDKEKCLWGNVERKCREKAKEYEG